MLTSYLSVIYCYAVYVRIIILKYITVIINECDIIAKECKGNPYYISNCEQKLNTQNDFFFYLLFFEQRNQNRFLEEMILQDSS